MQSQRLQFTSLPSSPPLEAQEFCLWPSAFFSFSLQQTCLWPRKFRISLSLVAQDLSPETCETNGAATRRRRLRLRTQGSQSASDCFCVLTAESGCAGSAVWGCRRKATFQLVGVLRPFGPSPDTDGRLFSACQVSILAAGRFCCRLTVPELLLLKLTPASSSFFPVASVELNTWTSASGQFLRMRAIMRRYQALGVTDWDGPKSFFVTVTAL